jgi:crossover junction endodeoxyribonuclease RusA
VAELVITVTGTPAPQGSKSRGRNGGLYESSRAVRPWRQAVAEAWSAGRHKPLVGPVELDVTFYVARPAGHYRKGKRLRPGARPYPWVRPDLDKYLRATLDALSKDVSAISDDSRVITVRAAKRYAGTGVQPGALIRITEVPL